MNINVTGSLPNGPSFDIVSSGGYLFVAEGSEVRVYFTGTESQIRGLGWGSAISKVPVNDAIYALTLNGNYLYVVSGGKVSIMDISTRSSPRVIAAVANPYPYTTMRDIAISGTTAYISVKDSGILVVNVTDPVHPVTGQKVTFQGYNRPWRLAVSGQYLYVPLETDGRLEILDISQPLAPVSAGQFNAGEMTSFSGVVVQDGYAYVSEYHTGIRVIDVRNVSRPKEVVRVTDVNANDIRIQGNRIFVSVRYQGFTVYDIPTPGTLRQSGMATGMEGYIEGVWPSGNRTYLAGESFGYAVYDTSNISSPSLMVKVPVIGGVDSLALYGDYIVVGAHNLGVWMVDVTDRAHPKEVAFIDVGGRNRVVDIDGSTLYTAGEWGGLSIVNISDPLHPVIKTRDFGDNIGSLLADGRYVYTQAGIVDVSNQSAPVYVSKDPMFNGRFAKYGADYLLVADSQSSTAKGLRIIDIHDPKNPRVVATFGAGTAFNDVVVTGSTAVGLAGNDVIAIDFSEVTNPREVSRLNYAGTWYGNVLSADGSMVYGAGGPTGVIRAFNVTNPSSMTLAASADLPATDTYLAVAAAGADIYAGNKWGLYSLTIATATPVPTATVTPLPTTTGPAIHHTPERPVTREGRIPLMIAPLCAILIVLYLRGRYRKQE